MKSFYPIFYQRQRPEGRSALQQNYHDMKEQTTTEAILTTAEFLPKCDDNLERRRVRSLMQASFSIGTAIDGTNATIEI